MKALNTFGLFLFALFLPVFAFAQEAVPAPISNDDFLKLLIESIGGAKGASALVIAGIVVKVLLAFLSSNFFNQFFKNVSGAVKLLIVSALSLASGVIALMVSGLPLGAALVHSSTLTAFLVLFNQIYKQFIEKKA